MFIPGLSALSDTNLLTAFEFREPLIGLITTLSIWVELYQPGQIRGAWPARGWLPLGQVPSPLMYPGPWAWHPCARNSLGSLPLGAGKTRERKGTEQLALGASVSVLIFPWSNCYCLHHKPLLQLHPFLHTSSRFPGLPLGPLLCLCFMSGAILPLHHHSLPSIQIPLPLACSFPALFRDAREVTTSLEKLIPCFCSSFLSHTPGKVSFGNLVLYEPYEAPLCQEYRV